MNSLCFGSNVISTLWVLTLSCRWTVHLPERQRCNPSNCCCWWNLRHHCQHLHCIQYCHLLLLRMPRDLCLCSNHFSSPKNVQQHRLHQLRTCPSVCWFCQWDAPSVDCSSRCFGYSVASQIDRRAFVMCVMCFAFWFCWCNWSKCVFRWFCREEIQADDIGPFRLTGILSLAQFYWCERHRCVHVTPSSGVRCTWHSIAISSHCDWGLVAWLSDIAILSSNRTTASEKRLCTYSHLGLNYLHVRKRRETDSNQYTNKINMHANDVVPE